MSRRPFWTLLGVAGVGLALLLALLAVLAPMPLRELLDHCRQSAACRSLLLTVRMDGGPLLLAGLLLQLVWSGQRGLRAACRQWRATRIALDSARGRGVWPVGGTLAALCAELGLAGRVTVVDSSVPVAFCHGLWRPRICISRGALALLGPAELRAVLRHEQAHLRRRDPLQLLVARSLAAALPYLPVLGELAAALPLTQELAADRAVMDCGAREALGRALLALVEAGRPAATPVLASGMVSSLDARIDQLTGSTVALPPLSRRSIVQTAAVLAGGLFLWLALMASTPPAPPPGLPPGHSATAGPLARRPITVLAGRTAPRTTREAALAG